MNQAQSICVKTNTHNLIANLRNVFSKADKVLAELMQNARRAKATQVHFSFSPENSVPTLTVEDNGTGITDLQNLLTIAESGWDEKTIAEERSFGLGWLSALFSAQHVRVESKGSEIWFDCDDAIAGMPIEVKRSAFIGGTRITLSGFKLNEGQTKLALDWYAKGFAIPVYFNSFELARPYALENLTTSDTPIGPISVQGIHDGNSQTDHCWLYYQGLQVDGQSHHMRRAGPSGLRNVIHLKNEFGVRMPDRDSLIDAEIAEVKIREAIGQQWQNRLYNDIPLLPKAALWALNENPARNRYESIFSAVESHVPQEAIQSGKQVVLMNVWSQPDGNDGRAFGILKMMAEKGWLEIADRFDPGHWVYQHAIDADEVPCAIEYEPMKEQSFALRCSWGQIVLVDKYTIRLGDHELVVDDWSCVMEPGTDDMVVIVPRCSGGSEAADQLSNYQDEFDSYQEDWESEDRGELVELVSIMRGEMASVTILRALNSERIYDRQNCKNVAVVAAVGERRIKTEDLQEVLIRFAGQVDPLTDPAETARKFIEEMLQSSKVDS
jgi:hypothetical protein